MAFWLVVAVVLALILAAVYLLKPRRMPTVDIRKFPRKFSDEKVTFLHAPTHLTSGNIITITQKIMTQFSLIKLVPNQHEHKTKI